MYKIGTGECGTIAGKVYLFAQPEKVEDASWVYCRGKLYLRSGVKGLGEVSIVCPNTFKTEGLLQLYCPDIFGTQLQ
jgi:other hect domain ubiquitin protein ligase E3